MQYEWVIIGLLVLMALGLIDIRVALFGILRRERAIMATEQQIEDILSGISTDVDTITIDFTDFTNTIASLQGQLAAAGQPTDISSALLDKATAIKTKLDTLAASVSAPVDTTVGSGGSDTTSGADDNDVIDTTNGAAGSDTTGGAAATDTGDNGPPPA